MPSLKCRWPSLQALLLSTAVAAPLLASCAGGSGTSGVPPGPSPSATPAATFVQYTLAGYMGSLAGGITVGSDGALWLTAARFTSQNSQNAVWRVTTSGAATMEYSSAPNQIDLTGQVTTGSDGAVWFFGAGGGIGRITTSDSVKFFPMPSNALIFAMTKGPDGMVHRHRDIFARAHYNRRHDQRISDPAACECFERDRDGF
jgi:streptogramin lyase